MTVTEFVQYATDAIFLLIWVIVTATTIRHRGRNQIEAALFFSAAAYVLAESLILRLVDAQPSNILQAVNSLVLISMSYLLLRLVHSLSKVPPIVLRVGEVGLVVLGVLSLAGLGDPRFSFILPAVIYFLGFTVYATVIAANASRQLEGVTKQRLRAVALGSTFLGLVVVIAGVAAFAPSIVGNVTHVTNETLALACGVSYFVAFATPLTLRRAWQEPILRQFFASAGSLSQFPELERVVSHLEEGTRASLGGTAASVALWDEEEWELVFPSTSIGIERGLAGDMIEGAAFQRRDAVFSANLARDFPLSADVYLSNNAKSAISAPIASRDGCLGTLSVYFAGSPLFIDDDLSLLKLMANQVGIILESRELVEEETRLRAREEALRLRNDFLSSVAHDLKTPLTALVMQSQLLERRARKTPDAPVDVDGLHQILVQTHRLRSFVEDLLDVQRSEDDGIALTYEPCELAQLVREVGQRVCVAPHTFILEIDDAVELSGDRARLTQLFDNLIGNAVKYSPEGGEVRVSAWADGDDVHVMVTDEGIGIDPEDLPHVFDRHHRGDNAKEQGVHGIGLGLFICRAIVQAHGGTLEVESTVNHGSTFHAVIPRVQPPMHEVRDEPRNSVNEEPRVPSERREVSASRIVFRTNSTA